MWKKEQREAIERGVKEEIGEERDDFFFMGNTVVYGLHLRNDLIKLSLLDGLSLQHSSINL